MQPLVPKIRAGEVLRGTRNLRHWLRTASILHNLETLHRNGRGFTDPSLAKGLYTPQKDDAFVVAANTPFHFCAWSPRQNVTLIFINPTGAHVKTARSYMNPSLFATWFVRTNEYNLDLKTWPHSAYYLWAMLQMNGMAVPGNPHGVPVGRYYSTPFRFSMDMNYSELRGSVTEWAEKAAKWGRLRTGGLKAWHAKKYGVDFAGFGPRIDQLYSMQSNIREYLSNTRRRLVPGGRSADGFLDKVVLEALQKYKENPELAIEAVLKNYR